MHKYFRELVHFNRGDGMEQDKRISEAYKAFFQAVQEEGVQGILQEANRIFESPVFFTDEYFSIVSMCPARPIGDKEWDYLVEKKHLNREFVFRTLDEYLSGQQPFYAPFYANTGTFAKRPRIMGEIVKDETVLGHVVVILGDRPLQEGDLEIMGLMIDAIKIKLAGRIRGMARWNEAKTTKFRNLLDPTIPAHLAELSVKDLRELMPPDYSIIATPVGKKASQIAFAEYAVYQLQQSHSNVIVTLFGSVVRSPYAQGLSEQSMATVQDLFDFFGSHDLISGLSNCYSDLADTYTAYQQAVLAAEMSLKLQLQQNSVFMDYMPIPIFLAALKEHPPETYVHPVLYRIRDYDAQHGTEYFNTLRVFSMNMHSRDKTASRLGIHRNTLLYRLDRIVELFGLPYEDRQTALTLLCSFLVLEVYQYGTLENVTELLGDSRVL